MDLSTLTHLVGQLNQIQRYAEELHQVKNRRELKVKADEIDALVSTIRKRLFASYESDQELKKQMAELEDELKKNK